MQGIVLKIELCAVARRWREHQVVVSITECLRSWSEVRDAAVGIDAIRRPRHYACVSVGVGIREVARNGVPGGTKRRGFADHNRAIMDDAERGRRHIEWNTEVRVLPAVIVRGVEVDLRERVADLGLQGSIADFVARGAGLGGAVILDHA